MKELVMQLQLRFLEMCNTGKLFRSSLEGTFVWDLYLNGFSSGDNPIFRDPQSSTHNCNNCNNFIRRYGNIVSIDNDLNVTTIWDNVTVEEFINSAKSISKTLKEAPIKEIFLETFNELNSLPYEKCSKSFSKFQLGISFNHKQYSKEEVLKFGRVEEKTIYVFNHLHLFLPKEFVDTSGKSIDSIMATFRDAKNVFKRAMEDISLDTLELVRDLINQDSLLDGKTHLYKVEQFITLKKEFDLIPIKKMDNWCWTTSYNFPLAKFKNELIGVLCSELSEGEDLNKACQSWNKRVDPINYMKTTAPITKKQIEEAKKFVEENGYSDSFNRRLAVLDDIKVSEILHSNVGDGNIKNISIFDSVKSTSTQHKRQKFDGVEEVSIEQFMRNILPNCNSIEAYFDNSHTNNLVTLTTSNVKDSKPIFKWDNNYSYTFIGNIAGKSMIKQAVKSRGGSTDGIMRISLFFPSTTDDYDLHLIEPNGYEVYFSNLRTKSPCGGILDLDAQGRDGHQIPEKRVENIIYADSSKLLKGVYKIYVNNYSSRGLKNKFTIEIEINGEITLLESSQSNSNNMDVGEIQYNGTFSLIPAPHMKVLESKTISKEVWGIDTNNFHKVDLVCLSPNHWAENNIGNKYYLFMLDKCKCSEPIRSFHIENLTPELLQHKKVLEVLGNTTITPTNKQLSGLGFNATVRDELIVKIKGTHQRMLKIKF
jgi:hypothetical protein